MAQPILVPQVGQDLTEARIVELNVKLGDRVAKGDVVALVESEKASFEVEAFAAGTVLRLHYAEGDTAEVLTPLMDVGEAGEAAAPAPDGTDDAPVPAPEAEPGSPAKGAPVRDAPATGAAPAGQGAAGQGGGHRSSPHARRVAAERGIDIAGVDGSGPGGAVVLRDLDGAVASPAIAASGAGPLVLRTLQAGQGAPVVFLHGFGADLSSWRPLLPGIGLSLPMLALDLPGHGASAGQSAADFDAIVAMVGRSLTAVEGGVHLVGHSLGAAVAAALTERGDVVVRSLTLAAPAGLGASIDGDFVAGFLAARTAPALRAWMERLVHDPAALTPTLVRATMEARRDDALVAAQRRIADAVFEGLTQLFSVRAALSAYDGPASVVLGRGDAIVSPAEVTRAVPGHVALHHLPGVGHLPQIEAPGTLQRVVARTVRAAG